DMFCPNCGKQINGQSNFCTYCGYKFDNNNSDNNSDETQIYQHSYYKETYKKNTVKKHIKTDFSFGESFLKGVTAMFIICLTVFAVLLYKNYYSGDMLNLDRMKYRQYVENPSLIPELSQPETLNGLVDNLKDIQNFLALYLKVADDNTDTKLETFDKYRKELLKLQNFDNTNLLQENAQYPIPHDEKEFKTIKKQYEKTLSQVGLTIAADESYSKYHLEEDNRFTYKKFGKYLPSDINSYLKLRAKNYKQCIFQKELAIKPFELAKRIGEYETFMNANKEFRYIDEVKDLLFSYTLIYSFTTDRLNTVYINNKVFSKSDKKFIRKYPLSQLNTLFSHLASSANGISESQFDNMYPYEYQKTLEAIKPDKSELTDVFTLVRKNIIQLKSDANYQYIYNSSDNCWIEYNSSRTLKKGDVILAQSEQGYDIYDYKYKRTNQIIKPEPNAKFFIKSGQLYAYSPNHLQISSLDNVYGSLNFRTLSVKAIKKIFPDILIINIDTFGDTSVQIDKPSGTKTYMLISTSGVNYDGYHISGNVTHGELSNIFTVTTDEDIQVNWTCDTDGESYHIYFITRQAQQNKTESDAAETSTELQE
ncbi:MAG: zinc-ribbon domain-containing protein, partial [Candidatus Gastranaerophilales bacterium]|nr:zinc-ribbon domain-containing protein [Candidatus Gastranaerophilales bacterium]